MIELFRSGMTWSQHIWGFVKTGPCVFAKFRDISLHSPSALEATLIGHLNWRSEGLTIPWIPWAGNPHWLKLNPHQLSAPPMMQRRKQPSPATQKAWCSRRIKVSIGSFHRTSPKPNPKDIGNCWSHCANVPHNGRPHTKSMRVFLKICPLESSEVLVGITSTNPKSQQKRDMKTISSN